MTPTEKVAAMAAAIRDPRDAAGSRAAMADTTRPRYEWIDSAEFDGCDYRPSWLIERVLVANEPAVLAAPVKSLKTSIGLDACISMATGTPMLGTFAVPSPIKVAIASMESGRSTLQGTARRICAAKGIDLRDIGRNLVWTFSVPTLSDRHAVAEFVVGLTDRGVRAVLLDPLYLCLGDVDAKNMMEVGAVLRSVSDMLVPAGITPIIVHHANRQATGDGAGKPMDLSHIAYSGCDAFARQFVLLSRREKYAHDGNHALWLSTGGSAGHGGLYAVDVAEGIADRDFGGRRWDVTVTDAANMQRDAGADREAAAAAKVRAKMRDDEAAIYAAIDSEASKGQPAATATAIKRLTGLQSKRVNDIIQRMLEDGTIEHHEWTKTTGNKSKMTVGGYRRPVVRTQAEMTFDRTVGNDDLPTVSPTVPSVGAGQGEDGRGDGRESSPLYRGDSPTLPTVRDLGDTRVSPSPDARRLSGAASPHRSRVRHDD